MNIFTKAFLILPVLFCVSNLYAQDADKDTSLFVVQQLLDKQQTITRLLDIQIKLFETEGEYKATKMQANSGKPWNESGLEKLFNEAGISAADGSLSIPETANRPLGCVYLFNPETLFLLHPFDPHSSNDLSQLVKAFELYADKYRRLLIALNRQKIYREPVSSGMIVNNNFDLSNCTHFPQNNMGGKPLHNRYVFSYLYGQSWQDKKPGPSGYFQRLTKQLALADSEIPWSPSVSIDVRSFFLKYKILEGAERV